MSIMGEPRLANARWAANAKSSYECKTDFYKIMCFIIFMNCDWFPDWKKTYSICKTAPAARLYSANEKCI